MSRKGKDSRQRSPQPGPERHVDDLARRWLTEREVRDAEAIVTVGGRYGREEVAIRLHKDRVKALARFGKRITVVVLSTGAGWAWGTRQAASSQPQPHAPECRQSTPGDESG